MPPLCCIDDGACHTTIVCKKIEQYIVIEFYIVLRKKSNKNCTTGMQIRQLSES